MKLYHGTSNLNVSDIIGKGLVNPYLTNQLDLAIYYSECAVEEDGGEVVILSVVVSDSELANLRYDRHATSEPVSFGTYKISELEDKVERMWEEQSILHPEWLKKDIIQIPKTEYQLSLDIVGSCWYDGIIHNTRIEECTIF